MRRRRTNAAQSRQLPLAGEPVPDHEDTLAFQVRAFRLPEPRRQYVYAEDLGRKFRADFAWPAHRLLVEVQGGIWRKGGGAHSRPKGIEMDITRAQHAAALGWLWCPVTTDQVTNGQAVQWIVRVLQRIGLEDPKP